MKKEWQVDIYGKDTPVNIDGIVIGDEGCIYRALDPRWVPWVEQAEKRSQTVRYVTPPVPNKYTEELFQYIIKLAVISKIKVTFNDYGMLYCCKELIEKERIIPVLGRIITRSITDCPWNKELMRYEEPKLAMAVTGNNLAHLSKWEVFRKFCIREVELNMLHSLNKMQLDGGNLILTGYNSNALVSVGRVCFSARWQGLELPHCRNDVKCHKKLAIEINKKWGKMKLMYEEPSEQVKQKYQDLYVRGNIVYKQLRNSLILEQSFDCQILNDF